MDTNGVSLRKIENAKGRAIYLAVGAINDNGRMKLFGEKNSSSIRVLNCTLLTNRVKRRGRFFIKKDP